MKPSKKTPRPSEGKPLNGKSKECNPAVAILIVLAIVGTVIGAFVYSRMAPAAVGECFVSDSGNRVVKVHRVWSGLREIDYNYVYRWYDGSYSKDSDEKSFSDFSDVFPNKVDCAQYDLALHLDDISKNGKDFDKLKDQVAELKEKQDAMLKILHKKVKGF